MFVCCHCKKTFIVKPNNRGSRNRSIKLGLPIYCSQTCTGLARRLNESPEEKKAIKYWYDAFLNISMTDEERELEELQRMVYFQWDYVRNPEKHRKRRQERMADHIEYCRQPEYKKWKKAYDEQYRAKQDYGDWWEAAIALKNLDKEIDYRESKRQNKIYNKSTSRRKRSWQKQLKQSVKSLQQLI